MPQSQKDADRDTFKRVYHLAYDLYCQSPNWVSFYRDVFGVNGIIRQHFDTHDLFAEFEQSDVSLELLQMLARLRERNTATAAQAEPTQVITVRIPKSLHDALKAEAHEHRTSMNQLCISKLLQFIDNELVPSDT